MSEKKLDIYFEFNNTNINLAAFNKSNDKLEYYKEYPYLSYFNNYNELNFEKSYMTDLLQGMIDEGYKIRAIPINNGWLELDSYNDYLKYQKMFENETISKFFNPYTS